jgi:hypothetical protein
MRLPRCSAPHNDSEEKGLSPFLEEERILRRIPLEIIALSFVIAIASLLFFSPLTAVFALGGGAFSALSFVWLKKSVLRLFPLKNEDSPSARKEGWQLFLKNAGSPSKEKGQKEGGDLAEPAPFLEEKGQSPLFPFKRKALISGLLLYALRLLLILAVFFIIILLFSRKIIAFAVGFSAIIPVFLAEAVIALSRMKQWKD